MELPIEDVVREKLYNTKEVNVVVLGCYQMGKSTLVNTVFSQGDRTAESTTTTRSFSEPRVHTLVIRDDLFNVNINIYDMPGLNNGSSFIKGNLYNIGKEIHLVIYCTKMGEPIRGNEELALKNLISVFRESCNFVIALTFANEIQSADPNADEVSHFRDEFRVKTNILRRCFKKLGHEQIFDGLVNHIYAVGSAREPQLPTGQYWKADFLQGCLKACQPQGKGVILKQSWTDYFLIRLIKALINTVGGKVGIIAGVGLIIAGGVLSAEALVYLGAPLAAGVCLMYVQPLDSPSVLQNNLL